MSHLTDFTGYVLFIITSFLASVEFAYQCLLNSKVLFCFSGVIMSIRSFFLFAMRFFGRLINCVSLREATDLVKNRTTTMKSHFAAKEVLCAVKIVEASIKTFNETVTDVVNLKNQNLWEGKPEERLLHETQFQAESSSSMGKSKFHSYWE